MPLELHQARIVACALKWQAVLGLDGWCEVTHSFTDISLGEDGEIARTRCRWEYREAVVEWSLPEVAALNNDVLEATVVHELCHVLLAPVEDLARKGGEKQIELAASSVARAFLATWAARDEKAG